MIAEKLGSLAPFSRSENEPWWERSFLPRRHEHEGPPTGWIIAGLAVLCLGVVVWSYVGRDVQRYIRMRNM
jgi:hypothetical protein